MDPDAIAGRGELSVPARREGPAGPGRDMARMQKRVEELERRNEELRLVAAAAAHELLTPLIAIEGQIRRAADDTVRHELDAALRGTTRMRVVIEALLRHEHAASRPLQRTRVDLGRVVNDCVALLAPEIEAREAEVVVGAMPAVHADAALLPSVIQNLLVNGLRYGARERGLITISALRAERTWRIAVESDGRPIAAGDRARIFEPFQRGAHERRVAGTGLGLAISRMIVERHRGTIGVEPSERGNRFFFTLPD
jgi:signal transduction histidine kinase